MATAMLIENDFTLDAPPEAVFDLMLDVQRVAPCLPGTEVLGRRDDGGYDGQMSVKLGPMRMRYQGTVTITDVDPVRRTATMLAKGTEARGQGSAQGTLRMTVTAVPDGGSAVSVATDIQLTGRVAQMGQGIMRDVSTRMVGDMAQNMEALLSHEASRSEAATGEPQTIAPPELPLTDIRARTFLATLIRSGVASLWRRLRTRGAAVIVRG